MGKLKRKEDKSTFPPRYCEWCEEYIIPGVNRVRSEYAKVRFCSLSCIASKRHHPEDTKATLAAKPVKAEKCGFCHKPLTRKAGEREQAWELRKFCDKSCAASSRRGNKPQYKKVNKEMTRLHCRVIPKGSEEFRRLEAFYQAREAAP